MNLGFASPVSLHLLRHLVANGEKLPSGYLFAPSADWVQELMRRGHHVTLYTTAQGIEEPMTFSGEGLSIRIARRRPKGAARDLFAVERRQLRQMMMEDRCQVIHAHWTYEFALAALASGIPTLITIHDHPWKVLAYFRDMYRVARLLMAYRVAFRGSHFTAVSEDGAAHFRRYFRPGANIKVIPNGLTDALFEKGRQSAPNRNEAITFATILQGWTRLKNAATALRAFQIVSRRVPDARLLMFGLDYEPGGPAQQWAIEQNLDHGVTFQGPLPYHNLLTRLRDDVDVLVHPSLNETFSMTALEGMALKRPVIVGRDTPGMRQMLGNGDAGVLVDMKHPSELAEAMIRLAEDASFRSRVAQNGFDRASSLYRLDTVITQYETLYRSLLQSST